MLEEKGINFKELEIAEADWLNLQEKIAQGGKHLAKILAKKCFGKLYEVTEKLHIPVFEEEKLEEITGRCLLWWDIKESLRWLRLCAKKTVARLPLGAAL
nr:hypothetical protein [Oribacterium sinus]